MDIQRLRRDIEILLAMKKQGAIRDVDWNVDGIDDWIIIYGAAKLPKHKFNYPDFNLKLPIPANLYEPTGNGRFHFYRTIFIDSSLRKRERNKWKPIARQHLNGDKKQAGLGWAFLCVHPNNVGKDTDIRSLAPIIQRFILEGR